MDTGYLVEQGPGGQVDDSLKDTLEGISKRHPFRSGCGPVGAVTLEAGGTQDSYY